MPHPQEHSGADTVCFTDKETETQESEPACPRSHAEEDRSEPHLQHYSTLAPCASAQSPFQNKACGIREDKGGSGFQSCQAGHMRADTLGGKREEWEGT